MFEFANTNSWSGMYDRWTYRAIHKAPSRQEEAINSKKEIKQQ